MDKYDREIAFLKKNPTKIFSHWLSAEPLFNFCGPRWGNVGLCGCLTQVRGGIYPAATDALTKRIRADERIPLSQHRVTIADLPVFAEWQRKLDKYAFRRKAAK